MNYTIGENIDLCSVIMDGPIIPMKESVDDKEPVPTERNNWTPEDKICIQNNAKARKRLICEIDPDEYNRIFFYQSAKQIWDTHQNAHEKTTVVKKAKIDNLNRQYELFRMKEGETIQDIHTRLTAILNEIYSL